MPDANVIKNDTNSHDANVIPIVVRTAINCITAGFLWDKVAGGPGYWSEVIARLEALENAAERDSVNTEFTIDNVIHALKSGEL